MGGIAATWRGLDARRRAVVAGATALVFAAVVLLARGTGEGAMALLYAGLDPAAAGEVVAALEARGVAHEVRGDAIWVAESVRDLERVTLAAEGLPAASAGGYELLDGLSGFGTTSQMFDAAYWRAKEGELARTILAVPAIRSARVHISVGAARAFRREEPPSAAVTVATRSGPLPAAQAQALRHLVAAAVPGLSPDAVSVIDADRGLLTDDEEAQAPATRADALARAAERLLEARVGPGNAVVEVSVDTVTETERITERRLDPESRVAISSETEESESTTQGNGGAVTVASNLPDGEAAPEGAPTDREETARATTNYDLSETSREVLREPGAVRRLTVAVLVNDIATTAEDGTVTFAPRPPEEIAALSALVASAVGLDEARGDVLTLRSLPFEGLPAEGAEAAAPFAAAGGWAGWLRPALLALVAVAIAAFVLRPLLSRAPEPPLLAAPPALEPPGAEAPAMGVAPMMMGDFGDGGLAMGEGDDPAARLRRLIEARQEETAQLLQSWLDEPSRERA